MYNTLLFYSSLGYRAYPTTATACLSPEGLGSMCELSRETVHIDPGFHEHEPGIPRVTLLEGAETLHRQTRDACQDMHARQGGGRQGEVQG